MKYKYNTGQKVIVKKQKGIYSREFVIFLERHDYRLTILYGVIEESVKKYYIKEMQEDSYFRGTLCRESFIEGLYMEETYEPIYSRFEILDI